MGRALHSSVDSPVSVHWWMAFGSMTPSLEHPWPRIVCKRGLLRLRHRRCWELISYRILHLLGEGWYEVVFQVPNNLLVAAFMCRAVMGRSDWSVVSIFDPLGTSELVRAFNHAPATEPQVSTFAWLGNQVGWTGRLATTAPGSTTLGEPTAPFTYLRGHRRERTILTGSTRDLGALDHVSWTFSIQCSGPETAEHLEQLVFWS